jgi:hypothetical protein
MNPEILDYGWLWVVITVVCFAAACLSAWDYDRTAMRGGKILWGVLMFVSVLLAVFYGCLAMVALNWPFDFTGGA